MPATDSEPVRHLRARIQGREERLKHLEKNHPSAVEAIAHAKEQIADLQSQLSIAAKLTS